jgi:hypothetical protein
MPARPILISRFASPQRLLQQGSCAEGNGDDHDDKEQTSSGCFNLDYRVQSNKRRQA